MIQFQFYCKGLSQQYYSLKQYAIKALKNNAKLFIIEFEIIKW